jgi:DNA (cytosine-5)-methyltransferase 1
MNEIGKFSPAAAARRPTFGLDNRMTVVLFAGMGGACDGLESAGFHVHVAINHDPVAVAVHKKRHPHTKHLRCDVFEADPREVTQGRGVRILHASPDCTHFSVAKGSKPVSKRRRSLAWVICRWLGQAQPEVVTLENVREITTWGPLIAKRDPATGRVLKLDGTVAGKGERVPVRDQWLVPDPRRKGRTWRAFCRHVESLGYEFEWRVQNFADLGVPTIRTRLLGVMRRDGLPIAWPERTHAPRKEARRLNLKPWIGAHTIVDWSLPVRSIFERKKDLAEATMRRIARGVVRHVIQAKRAFIVPITHAGNRAPHDTREPLRAVTTANRGELAVVAASMVQSGYGERPGQAPRVLDIEEPAGTQVDGSKARLVAAFMAQHNNTGEPGRSAEDPLSTIVTLGSTQGVVAATLGDMHGTSRDGREIADPLAAVSAGGNHAHLILAFLQRYYGLGGQDQNIADPLTALTGKARHGLVTVKVGGVEHVITDIGTRMLEPEEGAAAHGFRPGSLPDEIEIDGKVRRLTKTEKYHLVGNSVPPLPIKLLAECNVAPELMVAAE